MEVDPMKKRLTRRDFLKATGITAAGAGLVMLGGGCAPLPGGVAPTPTLIPPNYKLPACCSYDSVYTVDREPKRPFYGKWAEPLGHAMDYLDDPANFPCTDSHIKQWVQNCLAFSIDMLFEGDTHSARNGLASVAEIVTLYLGGYLAISLPDGSTPDKLTEIKFYDSLADKDLWDCIYFPSSLPSDAPVKPVPPEVTGSEAVKAFTFGKNDQLSMILNNLQAIADSFNLWLVFQEDFNTTDQEANRLSGNFDTMKADETELIKNIIRVNSIPDNVIDRLGADYEVYRGMTFENAIDSLFESYIGARVAALLAIGEQNSKDCEMFIADLFGINIKIKELLMKMAEVIDAAVAEKREEAVHRSGSIWNSMADCVTSGAYDLLQDWEGELHAWWGAKKYIMAAIAVIEQIPTIVTAINVPWVAPFAIQVAIQGFFYCWLTMMFEGDLWQTAHDITVCFIGVIFDQINISDWLD
jgi:hypothetical protein